MLMSWRKTTMFLWGLVSGVIITLLLILLTRNMVAKKFYAIYGQFFVVDQSRILNEDVYLYQESEEVAFIKSGTIIQYLGYDKISPIKKYALIIAIEDDKSIGVSPLSKDSEWPSLVFAEKEQRK